MPTSTTTVAYSVMIRKDVVRVPHPVSKPPFVVTSLTTKRYAPSGRIASRGPSANPERVASARVGAEKQGVRIACAPTDVPSKAAPRRPSQKPVTVPTMHVRKVVPSRPAPSGHMVSRDTALGPRSSRVPQTSGEGRPIGNRPAPPSATRNEAKVVHERSSRPSCIPSFRTSGTSVAAPIKGMKDVPSKAPIAGPPKPASALQKLALTFRVAKTTGRDKIANTAKISSPESLVSGGSSGRSDLVSPACSSSTAVETMSSHTIDTAKIGTPESLVSDDSSERSDGVSPATSSVTAVEAALPSPPKVGLVEAAKINSVKISPPKIVSPSSKDGTRSSMAALARVMMASLASSPIGASKTSERSRSTDERGPADLQSTFSAPRHATQPDTRSSPMGNNVSRIRNLFVPPLDEGAKASRNPATQMEIEILRARKKVAGCGLVSSRLEQLYGTVSATIVAKKPGTSDSGGPSRV